MIKWITLSEVNNDYFTIEKSTDLINWQIVSRIKGAGNSVVPQEYTHLDINSPEKTKYYRLKQTDFNGNFSYSEIEVLSNTTTTLYYPNPTKGVVTVISEEEIIVLSISGEDLTNQLTIEKNSSEYKLDLTSLSNGIYFLRIGNEFQQIIKN